MPLNTAAHRLSPAIAKVRATVHELPTVVKTAAKWWNPRLGRQIIPPPSVISVWSQKTLIKILGPWHPEQRTGWRYTDCRMVAEFF
jgi:hypothetical protein